MLLQNQGILPGIIIGTRTQNEPVTVGERAFIIASTKKALEDGYIPVKVQNFVSKKKERVESLFSGIGDTFQIVRLT